MTREHVDTLVGSDGRIATPTYALAERDGWEVRAQLGDDIVALRHCSRWQGVGRLHEWFRLLPCALCVLMTATGAVAQEVPCPASETDHAALFDEPGPVALVLDVVSQYRDDGKRDEKTRFYPALGRIVTGAGWVTVGGGYRQRLLGNRAKIEGSAAIAWRAYKQAQARFELPRLAGNRLTLGTEVVWLANSSYGIGFPRAHPETNDGTHRCRAPARGLASPFQHQRSLPLPPPGTAGGCAVRALAGLS